MPSMIRSTSFAIRQGCDEPFGVTCEGGVASRRPTGRDAIHGAAAAAEPGVNLNAIGVRLRAEVSQRVEAGGDPRGPGQNVRLPESAVGGTAAVHVPNHLNDDRVVVAGDQSRDHVIYLGRAAHPDMKDTRPGGPELLRRHWDYSRQT